MTNQQHLVSEWNRRYPVGTEVTVRRDAKGRIKCECYDVEVAK